MYYIFFYSGVTRNLRDTQLEILSFVGPKTYLVGHSVDSDLRALKIVHRRLIDTSELYPSARGNPFKVMTADRRSCCSGSGSSGTSICISSSGSSF